MNKYNHVRTARQTRAHSCHWPGCPVQVKPALWGCSNHWYMLPQDLRSLIWGEYRAGQEETMTPSAGYVEAAEIVQEWIRGFELRKRILG